jgi:hypothetical protein
LPNYAPTFGSIQECLWIKPLADKKINEVNINVTNRKRVLRNVQIPSPELINYREFTGKFVLPSRRSIFSLFSRRKSKEVEKVREARVYL